MMPILAFIQLLTMISWAAENPVMNLDRIETVTADRIQAGVLNPILGPGKSSAFVRLTLIVKNDVDYSERGGVGKSSRALSDAKGAASKPSSTGEPIADDDDRTQESHQSVDKTNDRTAVSREYADFKIVVLHDEKLPPKKIEEVRAALLAIYEPELKAGDIRFQAASFAALK
jgi:hypothetical protein